MLSSTRILLRPAACFPTNVWAGATPAVFSPRASGEKWGRSSPLRCITRVQTACRAMCNLYAPNNFASPLGDVNGDGEGYVCLSRTRHLSPRIFAALRLQRPKKKNAKDKLRPTQERARASIIFDPRLWKRLHQAYGIYQREFPSI